MKRRGTKWRLQQATDDLHLHQETEKEQSVQDHSYHDNSSSILFNAVNKAKLFNDLRNLTNQSPLLDENMIFSPWCCFNGENPYHSSESPMTDITNLISSWGFSEMEVAADGNCVFRAAATNIQFVMDRYPMQGTHPFAEMGFSERMTQDAMARHLRHLVCDEFLENFQHYYEAVNFDGEYEDYLRMVEEMRRDGFFNSDLGDAVLLAITNVLGTPIIVFTTQPGRPVFAITPTSNVHHVQDYMYVVFRHDKAHFNVAFTTNNSSKVMPVLQTEDSAVQVDMVEQLQADIAGSSSSSNCRCGLNDVILQDRCDGLKCSCVKNGRCCNSNCRCQQCANNKCSLISSPPSAPPRKRARIRRRHSHQKSMQSSLSILHERCEVPKRGSVNLIEKCILIEIIVKYPKTESINIADKYNQFVRSINEKEVKDDLNIQEVSKQMVSNFVKSYFATRKLFSS